MTRKVLLNLLFAATILALLSPIVLAGSQGARYDAEIQFQVQSYIAQNREFAGVTVSVADGIVMLRGTVPLIGDRSRLETQVRTFAHVAAVHSELAITSSVPDEQLYHQLMVQLARPALSGLAIHVHDGMVNVEGTVATVADHAAAVYIIENTPGVKGIDDRIVVVGN